MSQADYLDQKVSKYGLRANPKNLESLTALEFPRTLKGLQSVLGGLNYYHRFLPDFAVYVATLYELTECGPGKDRSAKTPITDHSGPNFDGVPGEKLHVLSGDGSAKTKREGGAFSAVIWGLPEWEIAQAASGRCQLSHDRPRPRPPPPASNASPGCLSGASRRLDRVRVAQDEELWIANLKRYLRGDLGSLSRREAKDCREIAPQYEEGESGLLYYRTKGDEAAEDRDTILTLVVPETLRDDILHHYHASLERGHQRINASDDISTGQGSSRASNTMSESYRAARVGRLVHRLLYHESELVTKRADGGRCEEAVFRRFGASEAIQHDREPGFMVSFFKAFSKMMGQRQRATLTYRPLVNGAAERMAQTVVRAVKMYITDIDQRDWDEYAERLTFALNTSYDRTRDETPFYLVHGWDARSTLEATLPGRPEHVTSGCGGSTLANEDPATLQKRHYKMARTQAHESAQEAVAERARRQNEDSRSRLASRCGYGRHALPAIPDRPHLKAKSRPGIPVTTMVQLTILADERFDFDEELLPDDSWNAQELEDDGFEIEEILDMREGCATRYGRTRREFKVRWKGYPDHTWVDETALNCGGLLYDFLRQRTRRNRFGAMQSHENAVDGPVSEGRTA
ncbi:unnamed protein product [Phytophthora fragariaefolia]|uniref:Unnamed protein product n=1 Tax=Phytophthora fragariaefolia TaxID=1490495 RepID=A0A9W6WX98_9STRA|nr:unnamed protein product [Phytophthora fragariaefolia]